MGASRRPISEVLTTHRDRLMALPGVIGVGEGEDAGAPVILLLVADPASLDPTPPQRLPAALEGWPVMARVVGGVEAGGPT